MTHDFNFLFSFQSYRLDFSGLPYKNSCISICILKTLSLLLHTGCDEMPSSLCNITYTVITTHSEWKNKQFKDVKLGYVNLESAILLMKVIN